MHNLTCTLPIPGLGECSVYATNATNTALRKYALALGIRSSPRGQGGERFSACRARCHCIRIIWHSAPVQSK